MYCARRIKTGATVCRHSQRSHTEVTRVLTTDYINHFSALAMLIEMLPDFPEAIEDLRAWQPKTYADHLRAITFTDPAPLLADYAALPHDVRAPFDATISAANAYGVKIIAALEEHHLSERERRDLCAYGHALLTGFIQHINSMIAGSLREGTMLAEHEMQSQIDALLAQASAR